MELNEMGLFATVVDQGSFTKAANKLGMPKSTVSRHISQLEERLGARLLNRTTRQLKPTEVGKLYFQHCQRIVEEAEQAQDVIQKMQAEPSGLLRITMPLAFGLNFIQDLIHDFLALYPKIKVELYFDNKNLDILDEELDVALRIGTLPDSTMIARHIGATGLVLCATPEYLTKNGTPQTPEDLAQHQLIRHAIPPMVLYKDQKEIAYTANDRLVLNDMQLCLQMTLKNMGIGMVPKMLAVDEIEEGRLVEVLPDYDGPEKDIFLVYASRRQQAAKVLAFINFAMQRIKEEAPWSLPENWDTSRAE